LVGAELEMAAMLKDRHDLGLVSMPIEDDRLERCT
jgi:hypothetical protein